MFLYQDLMKQLQIYILHGDGQPIQYGLKVEGTAAQPMVYQRQKGFNSKLSDATSGVFLDNIYFSSVQGKTSSTEADTYAVEATVSNFKNSLLGILGWEYRHLLPKYGSQNARHIPGFANRSSNSIKYSLTIDMLQLNLSQPIHISPKVMLLPYHQPHHTDSRQQRAYLHPTGRPG